MSDDFPFDRPHWLVSVDFPMSTISRRDELFDHVRNLADRYGGREAGSSEPAPGFAGLPGYREFGIAVAFEAGDANTDTFVNQAKRYLSDLGISEGNVAFDSDLVIQPAEPEGPSFR